MLDALRIKTALTIYILFVWSMLGLCCCKSIAYAASGLSDEQKAWLDEHKVLYLGYQCGYSPIGFSDQYGKFQGITADFIALIQEKLAVDFICPVCYCSSRSLLSAFNENKIDIVSSIVETYERSNTMLFTDPYLSLPLVIIVRQNIDSYLELNDLSGQVAVCVNDYAAYENLYAIYSNVHFEYSPDLLHGLEKLLSGQAQALVTDIVSATYCIEKDSLKNLKIAGKAGVTLDLSFVCRKSESVLHDILQYGLSLISAEERDALYSKWMGFEAHPFYQTQSFWYKVLVVFIAVMIIAIAVWSSSLKRLVLQKTKALQTELDSRITAEKALAESEERYRLIIEQTHHMVYDYHIEKSVVTWGGAITEITGFSVEDFSKFGVEGWKNRIHPDDREEVETSFFDIISKGVSSRLSYRFQRADGQYINLDVSTVLLKNAEGKAYRVLGTLQDVTERIRNEEEIRKFKTISDNANFGVAILDPEGFILYSNRYFASVHGYSIPEVIGKHYKICYSKKYTDQLLQVREELLTNGCVSAHEINHVRKDGTEFPMMHHLVLIRDAQGNPVFTAVMAFDITKRKFAEDELRKFKTISDNANYGVSIVDTGGNILYTNKYYAQVHGYTLDELLNQHFTILHNEEQMRQVEASTSIIMKNDNVSGHEIWHTRKDGTVFPMLHNSVVIRGEDGDPLFTAATAIDITEKLNAEAEMEKMLFSLAQKNKELEEVNKELNNFTHVASHDLRNPIAIIQSFAMLIQEHYGKDLPDKVMEYVTRINRASGRMDELVDNLLTLSRISRIKNPFEKVDIQELVDSIVERLEDVINQYNVDFTITSKLPILTCDKIKLGEVFLNLIENAIKYSSKNIEKDKPVKVELGCTDGKSECKFYVKDNGVGIPEEYHKHIFESFTRLYSNSEYPGTGLGLSIVQKVIEDHGGKIWVESEEDKGATFFFTISKHIEKK